MRLRHQKRTVSAACHDLSCRFAKEASSTKAEMLADIDFLDVTVRQEMMHNVPGQLVQIQLGVVPCYVPPSFAFRGRAGVTFF